MTQLSQSELLELKALEARPPREAAPHTENPIARPSQEKAEAIYREMLAFVGEDPSREGLLRTPHRVVEALKSLTSGYEQTVPALLNGAIFHEDYDDMVVVKDIEFYSLVRASHAAVLWQSPCGVHPERQNCRLVQNPTPCRYVRPEAASAGAPDNPDRRKRWKKLCSRKALPLSWKALICAC